LSKDITIDNEDSALLIDRVVFESRKYLDLSSELTIAKSLPEALMTAREERLIISQSAKNTGM
jgi:hypothetical protein